MILGAEDVPYGPRLLIEAHYLFVFLQIARQGKVLLNLLNPTKLSIQQTGKREMSFLLYNLPTYKKNLFCENILIRAKLYAQKRGVISN